MSVRYVGIDMAQASFMAVGWRKQGAQVVRPYPNNHDGYKAMSDDLHNESEAEAGQTIHLIVEPTGGYQAGLLLFAYRQGWQITLVNPLHVRRWAEGMGKRAKTDRQDALMLAEFGVATQPPAQEELPVPIQQLDLLLRRQQDVRSLLQAERNRLFTLTHYPLLPASVRASLERVIQQLECELLLLHTEIRQFLKAHPALRQQRRLLLSIPGIGACSVLPLLVLLYRFQALTAGTGSSKQLVAFLGLDPTPFQSGRSIRRPSSISKKGDKVGRALLYMAALGGVSGNNPLRTFYTALVARGKPKKLALVAATRKMLTWAWAIFTSGSPFDPTRYSSSLSLPT